MNKCQIIKDMSKQHIPLQERERKELENLLVGGKLPVKSYHRMECLLLLDKGKSLREVSTILCVSYTAVCKWRKLYQKEGLGFLYDCSRSGRPAVLSGEQRAKMTVLACSECSSGRGRWTLRLLADKAVELGFCAHISHNHVRTVLKKTN